MSLIKNYEFIRDWVNHRLAADLQNYYTSSQVDTAIGNVSSSLSNYDTSTQVDTKIANAIAGVTQFDYEIVQALPASGVKGKIYLLPNNQSGQNVYDEYLYISGNWEKLGPQIDLSDYVTVSDYEEDEEVISAALNDLNTRIKTIEDADYDSQIAAAGQIDSVTFNGVPATITNKVAVITADIPEPDWQENDSTSKNYIKNRTHYYTLSSYTRENNPFSDEVRLINSIMVTKDDDGNNIDNYLSNTILKFESANSSQLTTTYSGQSEDGVMITATVHWVSVNPVGLPQYYEISTIDFHSIKNVGTESVVSDFSYNNLFEVSAVNYKKLDEGYLPMNTINNKVSKSGDVMEDGASLTFSDTDNSDPAYPQYDSTEIGAGHTSLKTRYDEEGSGYECTISPDTIQLINHEDGDWSVTLDPYTPGVNLINGATSTTYAANIISRSINGNNYNLGLPNKSGTIALTSDLSGKEDASNKVTSLSYSSTNTQYPSAKAVYDFSSDITLQGSQASDWDTATNQDFDLPTNSYYRIRSRIRSGEGYIPKLIWPFDSGSQVWSFEFDNLDDEGVITYVYHLGEHDTYYLYYNSDTIQSRSHSNTDLVRSISSSSTNAQSPSALAVYNYVEDKLSDIEAVLDEIITPTPILQASAESLTFECVAGSTQALTFTVGGNYLRGNINIAETDTSNVFTLNPTAGNNKITKANGEANTTVVTVTFAPSTAGQYTGSMTFSSTGAEPLTITFSATATAA